jgi:hypothetical protein
MNQVIECPCDRCDNQRQLKHLLRTDEATNPAIGYRKALNWIYTCEWLYHRTLNSIRDLRTLPSRFEAWVEAADADHFIAFCDRASEKLFIGIVVVIAAMFCSCLLSLLLESTR